MTLLGIGAILERRDLIAQLVRRELSQRYRGATLGPLWTVLQPLLLLAVYSFVFTVVFKARWPGLEQTGMAEYALVIFTGLITFSVFSDPVTTAPRLILGNANLVKQVPFPLEVIPIAKVLSSLFQATISLGVLTVGLFLLAEGPALTILLVPLVWIPLAFFSLGITFFVSSLGVFVRDLEQIVGVVVTALFFGSAIFFPPSSLPEGARRVVMLIPTSVFIDDCRNLVFHGRLPLRMETAVAVGVSVLVGVLGYRWFMRSRGAFADVV